MSIVHVGSAWNLQDCLRSSLPIKCVSQNFYPGDQRSDQFRALPIISLWGNMKMLPVSHIPTETSQLFQDHCNLLHLWWSGCSWWSGVTGRPSAVTWGHNPFFVNNSPQDGDRNAQTVPNDLVRQAALEDMHIRVSRHLRNIFFSEKLRGAFLPLGIIVEKQNFQILSQVFGVQI